MLCKCYLCCLFTKRVCFSFSANLMSSSFPTTNTNRNSTKELSRGLDVPLGGAARWPPPLIQREGQTSLQL